ncbi:PIG-L deacetylase family protein [Embleya sp. NPDC059237]|uniref:PIG-L deacetylase family protein n=1 Tax=Embleya sp. NPDC059237 TaxID=3346784 RepID=UPI0036BE0EDD
MAHPDDAELWCGGTLALHARHADVLVAVAAHDRLRDREAATGAAELGADLRLIPGIDAGAVHDLINAFRPEVVVTHPIRDVHPQHAAVAWTVVEALPEVVIATGHPRRLYTCDTYNSLTLDGPVHADTIVDVTATFPTKMRALRAHTSQPIEDHFGPMADTLARLWGARIDAARAEAYTAIPILGRVPASPCL